MIILFGGGFIGRHICCAAEGRAQVTVVARRQDDAFMAQHAPSAQFMSLEDFTGPLGDRLIARSKATVYLANTSIPGSNLSTPWNELSDNVSPAFAMFQRLARGDAEHRIVFASSGGTVYGQGDGAPIDETTPCAPISPYGLAKVMVEEALAFTARNSAVDPVVLRISNPVGRWNGARGQGLAAIAVKKALSGEPLTVYGDGLNVRDYFDADDLADLVLRICASQSRLDARWNVGSGVGRTVNDVLGLIEVATGRRIEVVTLPARVSDIRSTVLDPRRIARDFGWRATTPLEASIAKLVAAQTSGPTSSPLV